MADQDGIFMPEVLGSVKLGVVVVVVVVVVVGGGGARADLKSEAAIPAAFMAFSLAAFNCSFRFSDRKGGGVTSGTAGEEAPPPVVSPASGGGAALAPGPSAS